MVNQDGGPRDPRPIDPIADPIATDPHAVRTHPANNTTVVRSGGSTGMFIVIGVIVLAVIAYFVLAPGGNDGAIQPGSDPAVTAPADDAPMVTPAPSTDAAPATPPADTTAPAPADTTTPAAPAPTDTAPADGATPAAPADE